MKPLPLPRPASLLALLLPLILPLYASADAVPLLSTVTGAGPVAATWSYNLELEPTQDAQSGLLRSGPSVPNGEFIDGSFVTVYDFASYVVINASNAMPEDDLGGLNLATQHATAAAAGSHAGNPHFGVLEGPAGVGGGSPFVTAIQEPGTLALAGAALLLLGYSLRRRRLAA